MSAFETRLTEGIFTIFCPNTVEASHCQAVDALSKQCLDEKLKLVLLDLAKTLDIAPQAYRAFVGLHQAMKKNGTPMASIHVLPKLAYRLVGDGMSEVFTICTNPNDAYNLAGVNADGTPADPKKKKTAAAAPAQAASKKAAIDVGFINPFIQATVKTLETQANTPTRTGKAHIKNDDDLKDAEIGGVLEMKSKAFAGHISLYFPAKVFLAIYASMIGEQHTEITQEIQDAAGEILNMIFGQAKIELNANADYQIEKAIPTVMRGDQLKARIASQSAGLLLPFETDHGAFHLEVSLEK